MTLVYEDPGIWRAICDKCGDETILETDDENAPEDAEQELLENDWEIGAPEQVPFPGGQYSQLYQNHRCADCVEMIPTAREKYRKDKGREFGK